MPGLSSSCPTSHTNAFSPASAAAAFPPPTWWNGIDWTPAGNLVRFFGCDRLMLLALELRVRYDFFCRARMCANTVEVLMWKCSAIS